MLQAIATRDLGQPSWYRKRKSISALLPYAVWLERRGNYEMLDALLCGARASKRLMWIRTKPFLPTLFNKASPQAIVPVSPHVGWRRLTFTDHKDMISRWAAAASAIPYTEEVGQSVVDALLHIASNDSLRPHIHVGMWVWLEKRPSLPPECFGRSRGTGWKVVRHIRALGDIEILKSYFLLVWSEWDPIFGWSEGLAEMQASIREDFNGLEMGRHREDLIERLDHVL